MNQRRFRTQFIALTALALIGCTQLKTLPTAPFSPTPAPSATDDDPDAPAPAFSDSPAPSPGASVSPSADPAAPKVAITSPVATADFAASALDVTFTVAPDTNRQVVEAVVTYDGKVLATFTQNATSYRLEKWNPNLVNSAAGDQAPAGFGNHTLTVTVKDDKGVTGKAELKFHKPLRLGTWTESAAMPAPLAYAMAFSDAAFPPGYMVPWGTATEPLEPPTAGTAAYNFNPAGSGSWTTVALTGSSVPRSSYGAAVHPGAPGKVYLVGGRTGTQDLRSVELFSPLAKRVEPSLATLTNARMKPAVAILDNHLYVVGGRRGAVALSSVERVKLDAAGDPSGNFEAMADTPTARVGAQAIAVGKEIWLLGGGFKAIDVYDPAKNEWKPLTNASGATVGTPETFSDALMIPVGGRYYFFGGVREDGQALDRIHEFDPQTKTWRDLGALPELAGVAAGDRAEAAMAGCYESGAFYLMGGVSLPEGKLSNKVFKVEAL